MNHINVSMTVHYSADQTMSHLRAFIREHAPQTELTFTLRAPFDIAALRVGVTLHRDVTARITPLGDNNRAYAITWQPVAAGPFPAFAGTLFIDPSEGAERESIVTLDGHYHPPLGVAGDVFDAFVGKHIAQASAIDLLERIVTYIDAMDLPVKSVA